ncbi:gamma-parvin-like [Sycon ciliatum]|uniref:gamma-parvin-like n=1 Tax=Sycon ciliatum TaxID=27933 RepID=UPI0020AE4344|eukprot:scpid79371/ scgid14093/ Alpha-parvin; Actopaxin; CH-ILKBP; Calponin-like integrin-linked kinase-binding protein; Matrix-remodeling-associated protein 2
MDPRPIHPGAPLGDDQTDSPFLRRLRPKHLIQEEEDVAALMDASRTLKHTDHSLTDLSSPVRRQQYTTFFNDVDGSADRLAPGTFEKQDLRRLIDCLQDWVNDTLVKRRVIVRDLFLDIHDGVVLEELMDELTGVEDMGTKRAVGAVRGKAYVAGVLARLNKLLNVADQQDGGCMWTVERIWGKEVVATLCMMVALVHHFKPLMTLPDNVTIEVLSVKNTRDKMQQTAQRVPITGNERARITALHLAQGSAEHNRELDAFDKLFVHAPEKVEAVKLSLTQFANRHLAVLGWNTGKELPVQDLALDLHDGLLLIHLLSVLGGYYVPICEYHPKPISQLQKVTNMGLVFQLMVSEGLPVRGVPDDVVNRDVKTTMRIMYAIFSKFKLAPVQQGVAGGNGV